MFGIAAWIAARRLIVGGLIAVLDIREFIRVANELQGKDVLMVHGLHGTLSKEHVYLLPYNGIVFLTKSKEPLPLKVNIEAERLDLGPLPL